MENTEVQGTAGCGTSDPSLRANVRTVSRICPGEAQCMRQQAVQAPGIAHAPWQLPL